MLIMTDNYVHWYGLVSWVLLSYLCTHYNFHLAVNGQPNRQNRRRYTGQPEIHPRCSSTITVSPSSSTSETSVSNSGDTINEITSTAGGASSMGSTIDTTSPDNISIKKIRDPCPEKCPVREELMKFATERFWQHDLLAAYSCACHYFKTNQGDGFAQSMMYAIYQSKHFIVGDRYERIEISATSAGDTNPASASSPIGMLGSWDILGPFSVGKLEVDADPTFLSDHVSPWSTFNQHNGSLIKRKPSYDICNYILNIPSSHRFYSELINGGVTSWKRMQTKKEDRILEVRFPTSWNELVQGVSSPSVLEFQGWARATTYVKSNGIYAISCHGVHSVYIRNDNNTRLVTGDVYWSKALSGAIDLRIGPVAFIVPLRGVAQTSFSCTIEPSEPLRNIVVENLPDLLELEIGHGGRLGYGVLLSNIFALRMQNMLTAAITVDFKLETHRHVNHQLSVHVARPRFSAGLNSDRFSVLLNEIAGMRQHKMGLRSSATISIAPGQVVSIPLRITSEESFTSIFIPCRKAATEYLSLLVTPSRGQPFNVPLNLNCRKQNESFLISYLDHDGSVSQAGVLLPLQASPEELFVEKTLNKRREHRRNSQDTNKESSGKVDYNSYNSSKYGRSYLSDQTIEESRDTDIKNKESKLVHFPFLLSLHGTGITPRSQADAYKMMPRNSGEYYFGVEGFWVITPSRHGAHNWEAVGELSAIQSISALQEYLTSFHILGRLPQVDVHFGVIAGHSMGGHGAWMAMVNNPRLAVCLSVAAGWIKKEEYGTSNAFFANDVSSSYIDGELKSVLERAMGEFHVDKMVSNLKHLDVHIRVGGSDSTTHPYYSRRMTRLLRNEHVNCSYEELTGKQHWWWDTAVSNDGGVLNDPRMRGFYKHCLEVSDKNWRIKHEKQIASQQAKSKQQQTADAKERLNPKETSDNIDALEKGAGSKNSNAFISSYTAESPNLDEVKRKPKEKKYHRDSSDNKNSSSDTTGIGRLGQQTRCQGGFSLSVFNPAMQQGMCGLRVLQQFQTLMRSSISVKCFEDVVYVALAQQQGEGLLRSTSFTVCEITTRNVKRFEMTYGSFLDTGDLFNARRLFVNKVRVETPNDLYNETNYNINDNDGSTTSMSASAGERGVSNHGTHNSSKVIQWETTKLIVQEKDLLPSRTSSSSSSLSDADHYLFETLLVCIDEASGRACICPREQNILLEKTLMNYGPVRLLYARPFYIVYGTPKDLVLRTTIRDLAIYLANAHVSSHGTFVKVMSDLEYRSDNVQLESPLSNILFVGGPVHNKLLRRMCFEKLGYLNNKSFGSGLSPLYCHSPVDFHFEDVGQTKGKEEDLHLKHFNVGGHSFDDSNSIVFTFPIVRSIEGHRRILETPTGPIQHRRGAVTAEDNYFDFTYFNAESIMGLCLQASSAQGYLHLSRLAWSVVPPMVRAPFANYQPDVMVVDHRVWSHGFGGVKLAGYWNSQWDFEEKQSYVE